MRRPRSRAVPAHAPGGAAEALVADVLVSRGWKITDRRLRLGTLEADLIARRDDVVAVVEVRGRRQGAWQSPFATLDARKRRRLAAIVQILWQSRYSTDPSVRVIRIDVAAVVWRAQGPTSVEIAEGAIPVDTL